MPIWYKCTPFGNHSTFQFNGKICVYLSKFCTDLPTNSGKALNTSMTRCQPDPQTPRYPYLNWSLEKKLCFTKNVQMGDVSSSNFSQASPGPGWLVYIKQTFCMCLCPSFKHKPLNQSPPNFAQTSTPTWGGFLKQVSPGQPDPLTPGYPKLQNLEKNFALQKCIKFFPRTPLGPGWLVSQ